MSQPIALPLPPHSDPSPPHTTRGRWQILSRQIREGRDPCFGTELRHSCADGNCEWRRDCKVLRAHWQR